MVAEIFFVFKLKNPSSLQENVIELVDEKVLHINEGTLFEIQQKKHWKYKPWRGSSNFICILLFYGIKKSR